eukprot:TRINITY_DN3172_c0_g1_i2.p1 TRINITY_DN3172_c0_g1~~TRINITY_DN3172_c0_g1_i2.p1  ORF type:complete len:480 (-),score=69.64 TRINITY_DN3172_c0_g1_i2:425-1864(-)
MEASNATARASQEEETKWSNLLSKRRLSNDRPGIVEEGVGGSAFQTDFDRILFSAAFRRLVGKTQCFPLTGNDSVHTRLTHSYEVASVGRTLGRKAGLFLLDRKCVDAESAAEIADLVSAACLAHDIGNVPFGPSGESALHDWWEQYKLKLEGNKRMIETMGTFPASVFADFSRFEGNANGFHLLVTAKPANLTYATMATYTKYPITQNSKLLHRDKIDASIAAYKKNGIYENDKDAFEQIFTTCGLAFGDEARKGLYQRHPLSYLVEAADDICYTIIDLEDGYRLGYVDSPTIKTLLKRVCDACGSCTTKFEPGQNTPASEYRSAAIQRLAHQAFTEWRNCYEKIMDGSFKGSLLKHDGFDPLSDIAQLKLFLAPEVLRVEAAGYHIITKLMEIYADCLLGEWENKKPKNTFAKSVFGLLPEETRAKALEILSRRDHKVAEWKQVYELILLAAIYVCGMTEQFAIKQFNQLTGQSLGK